MKARRLLIGKRVSAEPTRLSPSPRRGEGWGEGACAAAFTDKFVPIIRSKATKKNGSILRARVFGNRYET